MRSKCILRRFLSTLALLLSTPLWAHTPKTITTRICHVSTNLAAILPRANDSAGDKLAFQISIRDARRQFPGSRLELRAHVSPKGEDIGHAMRSGMAQECDVFVGLVSSRDATLGGIALKGSDRGAISSTAVSNQLDHAFPHVVSASTSAETWAKQVRALLSEQPGAKAIMVVEEGDYFSLHLKEALQHAGVRAQILTTRQAAEGKTLISKLSPHGPNRASPTLLIFTTYPVHALAPLAALAKYWPQAICAGCAPADLRIIGSPAWVETHVFEPLRERLIKLPEPEVFMAWHSSWGSPGYEAFARKFRQASGKAPDYDSAFDYDVIQMIAQCSNQAESQARVRSTLLQCLSAPRIFRGLTGTYVYDGLHPHPQRAERLVKTGAFGQ
jgi:hypothetical protein